KSIHEHSAYKGKPFVAINCAAIPETLLESELFGYEKGAFTGANTSKPGKFEIANRGTLFLDEIGDMPLETQAKILRVLQDGQVERVGGISPVKVNVRLIAATNKDLSRMVDEGSFRRDLFYRLNVFSIYIKPLRERREDIPVLVDYFIRQLDKQIDVSPDTMQLLTAYNWPGNVRELKNTIESASVLANDAIEPVDLPPAVTGNVGISIHDDMDSHEIGIDNRLKDLEKGMIIDALMRCGGVQVMAARRLGIKERSLWHRIKKLEIDVASLKHK
ncbi:MAG: sigma-54 dependent transcriptional regulator, partial [Thermodesulfobacteriota bacterium]|nr:sigma-54 dependent transcriptional regulator [Thermodesulfobacteriota bacterium]